MSNSADEMSGDKTSGARLLKIPFPLPFQTPGEETANSILHGLGMLLAAAGLILFILRSKDRHGGTADGSMTLVCYALFSAVLIFMFLASTLYHAVQPEKAKRILQIIDHQAIYLLIAGTYTPYSLLGIGGVLGRVYFGTEWALALTGVVLHSVNRKKMKKMELAVYILMGWAIVFGIPRLWKNIPHISVWLLLGGGLVYTLGTFWYRRRHRRASHVIWHAFVLGGAFCHWLSLWFMS